MEDGEVSQTDKGDERNPPRELGRHGAKKIQKKKAYTDHQLNERTMANWSRRVGYFTGALLVASVASNLIIYGQLLEMRSSGEDTKQIIATAKDQVKVMQGQLNEMKVEQRPWVYADIGVGGAIYRNQGGGVTIPIVFALHNTGHLPASYVYPDIEAILPAGVGSKIAKERQQKRCAPILQQAAVSDQIGTTVFPGQTVKFGVGAGISLEEIETAKKAWEEHGGKQMDFLMAWVAGCIRYRSPDGEVHQTGTVFTIGMKKPGKEGVYALPVDPTSVDAESIILSHG